MHIVNFLRDIGTVYSQLPRLREDLDIIVLMSRNASTHLRLRLQFRRNFTVRCQAILDNAVLANLPGNGNVIDHIQVLEVEDVDVDSDASDNEDDDNAVDEAAVLNFVADSADSDMLRDRVADRPRRCAARRRARQRQKQNAVSRDEDQSQNIGATGEVPVQELEAPRVSDQFRTSGSPVASEGGSSAGTFGHIEPDNESPSWIYPVPPVAPADQPLHHVQFEDSSFATCLAMDTNDLDLTPFETTAPFTAFSSNTASPNFSSLCTVYQQSSKRTGPLTFDLCDFQPVEVNIRRRSSGSTRNGSSLLGPLHLAVRNGSKAIAQALLTAGANANSRDDSGALPLHLAVQHRRRSMADLLLTYGADPDAVNAEGITPLELAVRCRDEDIVNLLISGGARIT
ncbi:hypothetical protein DL769_010477 [Monosporascus sp. CRB-8-3]|nr:hypothetical protein DL769_010477 [Monosporascus sp. CRB-8-3]